MIVVSALTACVLCAAWPDSTDGRCVCTYRACVLMFGLTPQMVVVLDVMRLVAVSDDVEIGEVAIEVDAFSVRASVRPAAEFLTSSFESITFKDHLIFI